MENPSRIRGRITQTQRDGAQVGLTFEGEIQLIGPIEEVAKVVLEAEMHGNAGMARIHLFLE